MSSSVTSTQLFRSFLVFKNDNVKNRNMVSGTDEIKTYYYELKNKI